MYNVYIYNEFVFNVWSENLFEKALKEPLDEVMLHSENCSDRQIALLTDHFIVQTFRGCK